MRGAWGLVVGLAGCAAGAPEPYRLSLRLRPASGVDLAGASFRVDAVRAAGPVARIPLGADGTGLPPLPDDTVSVTVVALDGDREFAAGTVPFEGGTPPGSDAALEVAVAPLADLALWARIPEARRLVWGAVAIAADGRVFHFGGADPTMFSAPGEGMSPDALVLDPDAGETRFEVADGGEGVLPEGRLGLTATSLRVDGEERILVTGGFAETPRSDALGDWLLFDPGGGGVVARGSMPRERADHVAVPFRNGDVLVYGGYRTGSFPDPGLDVFDADRGAWKRVTTRPLSTGAQDLGAAALGDDVVVCGGYLGLRAANGQSQSFEPSAGCERVRSSGDTTPFDPLPEGRVGLALAPLGDDGLLAVGGWGPEPIVDTFDDDSYISEVGQSPARATAWTWSPGEGWTEAGDLAFARTYAAATPLADGRVLVFGGTDVGHGTYGEIGEPAPCAEVFDPATRTFEAASCGDQGAGARPAWAARPGGDIAVVGGYTFVERTTSMKGGATLGLGAWGVPPD